MPVGVSATHLYLLRHAEVDEKYQRVFGGRIDMGLSARGHEQARSLARWLRNRRVDAVYASPMQRVQLTLQPYQTHFPGTPIPLDGLREVDFGAWTGCGWDQVEARFGISAFDWLAHMEEDRIHDAEPVEDFRQRVASSLRQILNDQRGRHVAVFAHGGVIRMALSILLDLPMRKFEHFEVEYASATWVAVGEIKAGRPRTEVHLHNLTPWRDAP